MNTNLLENYLMPSSPQIPVQATPVAASVLGHTPDAIVKVGGAVEWNFPNYFTGEQVYLRVEAVNMPAQLSAWNVQH